MKVEDLRVDAIGMVKAPQSRQFNYSSMGVSPPARDFIAPRPRQLHLLFASARLSWIHMVF